MAEREQPAVVEIVDDSGSVLDTLETDGASGLAAVDALARLQVTARRLGLAVRVRGAGPALRGLLELTGVAGVVGCRPDVVRRSSIPRLPMPWRR